MSGRHRMPLSAWRKLKNAPTLRAGDDILAAYGLAMDELGVGPRGYFLPKALAEALDALLKEFVSKKIFPRIAQSIRPHAMRRWPRVGSKTSGARDSDDAWGAAPPVTLTEYTRPG